MSLHTVHHDNFAAAWFGLLQRLYNHGKPVSSRGYETQELIGVQVRVDDMTKNILVHPARALNYRFMISEWLWVSAGRSDVDTVARYNSKMRDFSDDGIVLAGAYGARIRPQIPWLLDQLTKSGNRQAVVQIWTSTPTASKDIPCTLSWQLLARDGKLHAVVTMRSSDVWLGIVYDFFVFSQLTNGIAGELGLMPGSLIYNLGSSHLYNRDREKAAEVLDAQNVLECISSPHLPCQPVADNILDLHDDLVHPWCVYRDVLKAKTSIDALACSKGLAT